jgi:hypothetical protein
MALGPPLAWLRADHTPYGFKGGPLTTGGGPNPFNAAVRRLTGSLAPSTLVEHQTLVFTYPYVPCCTVNTNRRDDVYPEHIQKILDEYDPETDDIVIAVGKPETAKVMIAVDVCDPEIVSVLADNIRDYDKPSHLN